MRSWKNGGSSREDNEYEKKTLRHARVYTTNWRGLDGIIYDYRTRNVFLLPH